MAATSPEPTPGMSVATTAAGTVVAALMVWTLWLLLTIEAPFVDLPQHVQNLTMLRHPDAYADHYRVTLSVLATNSPWFVIDRALAPVLSPEQSIALAYAIAISALPLATAAWARSLGHDPLLGAVLAWCTAWNGVIYWGFFHYAMATAVGFGVLALDRRLHAEGAGVLRLVALWLLLYLLHLQAWAWTVGMVVTQRLVLRKHGTNHAWHLLVWLPSALLVGGWTAANLLRGDHDVPMGSLGEGLGIRYKPLFKVFDSLVPNMFASLAWTPLDETLGIALLVAGVAGAVWSWRRAWGPQARAALAIGVLGAVGYVVVPREMHGQFHISTRLLAFVPPAAAVLASPPLAPRHRALALGAASLLAIVSQGLNHETLRRWHAELAPALTLMDELPPRRRLMFWPGSRESAAALGAPFTHISSWYAARNLGETHFSFAEFRPNPVVYRDWASYPRSRSGEEFRPWCTAFRGDARGMDYLLVRDDPGGRSSRAAHCDAPRRYENQLQKLDRRGSWTLYAVDGDLPPLEVPGCWCDPL